MTTKHTKLILHQIMFIWMNTSELDPCDGFFIVSKLPNNSVQDRAQAVAMTTKHARAKFVSQKNPNWMQTSPDFDPCNGLRTHNQHHVS